MIIELFHADYDEYDSYGIYQISDYDYLKVKETAEEWTKINSKIHHDLFEEGSNSCFFYKFHDFTDKMEIEFTPEKMFESIDVSYTKIDVKKIPFSYENIKLYR